VLQRGCREILLFSDRAQHPTGIHGAKFSQAEFADAMAKVITPDFVMALASAGSPLLFGPRQVSSLDEGVERYSRICAEPIAIDDLHERRPTPLDVKDVGKVLGAAQMLGGAAKLAGAVLLRDSLAILHIPCAMFFIQTAILITMSCFHNHSHLRVKPLLMAAAVSQSSPAVLSPVTLSWTAWHERGL
jgi:hypothetical protein